MKNTHRAILYASLFLLTIATFGSSSAMDKREPQNLKEEKEKKGEIIINIDALQNSIEKKREQSQSPKSLIKKKCKNCEKRKRDNRQEIDTLQASIKKDLLRFLCATGGDCIGAGAILVCPEPLKAVGLVTALIGLVGQGFCFWHLVNSLERIKKLKEKED